MEKIHTRTLKHRDGTTWTEERAKEQNRRLIKLMENDLHRRQKDRHWVLQKKNVFELVKPEHSDKILDIGCGTGKYEVFFSRIASITGVDISEHGIKLAEEMVSKYGNEKNAKFVLFNKSLSSMFKKNSFNKVIMLDSTEHMTHEAFISYLDDVKNVLTKDGRIFVYTPNKGHLFERIKSVELTGHINLMTSKEIAAILRGHGFVVEKEYYRHSHIPVFNLLERILPSSFLKRRICIVARIYGA